MAKTAKKGQVPTFTLKPNRNGVAYLMPFSDIHIGQESFNTGLFESHLEYGDKIGAYYALGGDLFEVAVPSHIPHAMWDAVMTTDDQFLTGLKYFQPRRDRVVFSTSGNHDARVWKKAGFDIARQFAMELGCFYNRNGGYFRVKVGDQTYTISMFHGHSSGMNPFAELEKRLVVYDESDVVMMGNNHALVTKAVVKKRIINNQEERVVIYLVRTGSFLNEPEYSREALYSPTLEGAPVVTFGAKKRYVHVDVLGEGRFG